MSRTWTQSPTAATGTAYNAGSVDVANGVDVTCTITNNDNVPKLTLNKIVINNNGGTATATDVHRTGLRQAPAPGQHINLTFVRLIFGLTIDLTGDSQKHVNGHLSISSSFR